MPTGRHSLVAASVNGVVYAIGGCFNGALRKVEAYNPAGNTLVLWHAKALHPAARSWPSGAAVINGKIYVPGGENGDGAPTKSLLFAYNPATDHWATKAAMPVASARGAVGAINGKLYVYTATNDGKSSFLYRYDPSTNAWTKRATPPHANQSPAAGVINGKLYLAGGVHAGSVVAALDVYDPVTNTWATKASMPTARWNLAAASANGTLFAWEDWAAPTETPRTRRTRRREVGGSSAIGTWTATAAILAHLKERNPSSASTVVPLIAAAASDARKATTSAMWCAVRSSPRMCRLARCRLRPASL